MTQILLFTLLCLSSAAHAQDTKLIEPARKDSKVIVYGTMQSDIFEPLQKLFQKKTGLTVDDYVRGDYRLLGDASYMSLFHKAPHPNAARAFIDFFLDEESMNIMAKAGEFVNRYGVYPPVPDADKIKFVEMDDLGETFYAEKRKEFHKLFR